MYIEFVISYILLGVLAVLLVVVIILQCIILKKISRGGVRTQETGGYNPYSKGKVYANSSGTAICRNCATPFDASNTVCPRCGRPR